MEKISANTEGDEADASLEKKMDPAEAAVNNWLEVQDSLKERLITEDDLNWKLPRSHSKSIDSKEEVLLKYVGGVDISFSKEDPSVACGCLVVLDIQTLQLVYEDYSIHKHNLQVPYVPGFLAFREAPLLLQLLENMKMKDNPFYPQVLVVDGNGLLHPRGFGLACHLGVLANLPTIGIGKNLHHVDGLTHTTVRQLLEARENSDADIITLKGRTGFVWGVAMRSTPDTLKPIFISVGHRISLDTAVQIIKMTCKYRVPEPIRQADVRSRDYLQKRWMGH